MLLAGVWLSLQPSLSLSPWTPHRLMRVLGMPYDWILAYEHLLPFALHAAVGGLLMCLAYFASLFGRCPARVNFVGSVLLVVLIAIIAEGLQFFVGRGFQPLDILFTVLGMLLVAKGLQPKTQ